MKLILEGKHSNLVKFFLIILVIIQFVLVTVTTHIDPYSKTINLRDEWEYTFDFMKSNVGEEINEILSMTEDVVWNRGNTLKDMPQSMDNQHIAWFRIKLPEGQWENEALYFEQIFGQRFDAYMDDKKIYSFQRNDDDRSRIIIPILPEYEEKYMYIRIVTSISRIGFGGDIIYGSHNYLLEEYFKSDFLTIILGVLLFILSITIAFNSTILSKEEKKRWFLSSIVTSLIGMLVIMYSLNITMFFQSIKQHILTWFLICLLLLSLTLTMFLETIVVGYRFKKIVMGLKYMQSTYFPFVFILHIVNVISEYKYSVFYRFFGISVLGIIMAVQFIFIAAIAIHLAINGNKEAKFFTVIFSVFLILSVLDIVLFNVSNQYYSLQMWKWGVLISAVGLLIVLGKRFVHVHDNIMSNAKVLENKNHELDMMWRSLLVSEEHLRQITENTIDLISESDLEGVFQYVTPSHYRVLGYTDEELVGRSIIDFLDPVYQEDVRNMIANLKSDLAESRVQVRFRHAEGDYRWLEIIGKLMHGTEGEPKGIIYSSRDITQRVKAEKSLRESEEKYRWLVDVLPDALYMRNKDTVLFANRAAAQQLGAKDPEELMGKKITDVFYPNPYCSSIFSEQMQLLQEMQSIPFAEEQLIRKRDGKIIDVEVAANIFQYSNDTVVLFVLRDMAERRRSEELSLRIEEKSRMLDEVVKYEKLKTDFFSNISHELRTPLNVILGSVQMMSLILKEPQEKPCIKLGKYVHVTRQNCYRLIRLINNLIDITKMDAGFFKLNRVNANIIHIVEEITLSVSEYIESRGLELIFDTEEEEVIIACDPDKIERIMLNLLSNSIKFTEKGGRISVMIKKSDDYVSISIEDTGIGIPADKQDLIFERFRQVDWSFTRSNEGSGIGLSLIKSLVEMHGGRILLKSEHGRGSEFTVQLPIQVVEQEGEEDEPHVHTKNIERIQIEFSDIYF